MPSGCSRVGRDDSPRIETLQVLAIRRMASDPPDRLAPRITSARGLDERRSVRRSATPAPSGGRPAVCVRASRNDVPTRSVDRAVEVRSSVSTTASCGRCGATMQPTAGPDQREAATGSARGVRHRHLPVASPADIRRIRGRPRTHRQGFVRRRIERTLRRSPCRATRTRLERSALVLEAPDLGVMRRQLDGLDRTGRHRSRPRSRYCGLALTISRES